MKAQNFFGLAAALLVMSACTGGGLPSSLRREIASEHESVLDAKRSVTEARQSVERDVSSEADLFRDTAAPAEWRGKLDGSDRKVAEAEEIDRELANVSREGRVSKADLDQTERKLERERTLREVAAADARAVADSASAWVSFKQDLPGHLETMQRSYDAIHGADLKAVKAKVSQAESDWPAKKDALESEWTLLAAVQSSADKLWSNTEAARNDGSNGKASGAEIATLIAASDELAKEQSRLKGQSGEILDRSGQLYDSWDKVLTDLDDAQNGREHDYREKIKTVRTHLVDVAEKKAETTSAEQWLSVSQPAYRAVENDIGMAIEHKDAGLFDDEAQKTPQPAGFAYIAPETQPGNQYGYWDHSGGHALWTWLPEYLILRELLWNHSYRPVVIDEYRGYRTAQRAGQTYFGRETPTSPPTYGTHGTFTQTHYAGSRYVQSGGFKGSAYAARGSAGAFSSNRSSAFNQQRRPAWSNNEGHRFGTSAGPSSGRRFGQSKGFRSLGRSFGRRR